MENQKANKEKATADINQAVSELIASTGGAIDDTDNSLTSPMSKEEAQSLSNAELLQMIKKAKGHTGKDFREYMHCDFSYTHLINLIQDRGYELGWHKVGEGVAPSVKADIINLTKPTAPTVRKSYILDADTAQNWKDFNDGLPFPSITLSSALNRFMADYNNEKIIFEVKKKCDYRATLRQP